MTELIAEGGCRRRLPVRRSVNRHAHPDSRWQSAGGPIKTERKAV